MPCENYFIVLRILEFNYIWNSCGFNIIVGMIWFSNISRKIFVYVGDFNFCKYAHGIYCDLNYFISKIIMLLEEFEYLNWWKLKAGGVENYGIYAMNIWRWL